MKVGEFDLIVEGPAIEEGEGIYEFEVYFEDFTGSGDCRDTIRIHGKLTEYYSQGEIESYSLAIPVKSNLAILLSFNIAEVAYDIQTASLAYFPSYKSRYEAETLGHPRCYEDGEVRIALVGDKILVYVEKLLDESLMSREAKFFWAIIGKALPKGVQRIDGYPKTPAGVIELYEFVMSKEIETCF